MDNTYASAPQVGLGAADLVVEELVEGGMTRLAAFYYSQIPGDVGPVAVDARQRHRHRLAGRRRDGDHGAAPVTINRINDAGIQFFSEGDKGFYRDSSRQRAVQPVHRPVRDRRRWSTRTTPSAPTTTCRGATRRTSRRASRPPRSPPASPAGTPRTGRSRTAATSTRTPTPAPATSSRPTPCWCCGCKVGDAGYRDPAGNPVPETKFTGQGQAMIFHGGRLVRGHLDARTRSTRRSSCRPRPAS